MEWKEGRFNDLEAVGVIARRWDEFMETILGPGDNSQGFVWLLEYLFCQSEASTTCGTEDERVSHLHRMYEN